MNYRVSEALPAAASDALGELHQLTKQLLFNRGILSSEAAAAFLRPSYDEGLHDPWLMPGIEAAAERILAAIEKKEQIAIFSDYDCDGIPGAVILHDFFKAAGHTNFTNYIPHRHYEGFGFSEAAAKKLASEGATLIITIDCGVSDHAAVSAANKAGVDVIITDHHEPKQKDGVLDLPAAVAVVNPKIGDSYPFGGLCGAGVVYKLVLALMERGTQRGLFSILPGHEKWWLDMVGIATIADMVPLIDENRVLAHYGLYVLRKSRRPGLQQLLRAQRLQPRYLTEDDIGFTIGPRINAASRMDTPEDAFALLSTLDEAEAGARLKHLEKLNNERKGIVAAMTKEVHRHIKELSELPSVMVFGNPDWRPALVGLVASKIAEEYNRPCFMWGRDGNDQFKGSCRSGGEVSVVKLMEAVDDHFSEHGGHHQSGGFTVKDTHIHTFHHALEAAMGVLGNSAIIEEAVMIDAAITLDDIDRSFLNAQKQLAPFGVNNPKPIYEVVGVVAKAVDVFGKTREHTKLVFDTDGLTKEAIAFFRLPEQFSVMPTVGKKLTLLAHLEESFFMGRVQVRLRIVDIVS